jgi:phosphopantothenoylcysteine decarboxylase/phosphopantothenate--cysteine ligase
VADFRPEKAEDQKLKKEDGPPSLILRPTTDILATLGKRKEHQVLVGFAAETRELDAEGRRKLAEKNLDLIVVNEVGRAGTGFDADSNRAAIFAREGQDAPVQVWTKRALAAAICDRLTDLFGRRR